MKCDCCRKDKKILFGFYGQSLCLICKRNKEKGIFKKGTRVFHETMGIGTVVNEPYYTRDFTTWTCVKYDDYLGQRSPLCGETDELKLVEELKG